MLLGVLEWGKNLGYLGQLRTLAVVTGRFSLRVTAACAGPPSPLQKCTFVTLALAP